MTQGQKFTHRIVRKQYGRFADAPPSPCRFFLRIENGVLELAPDIEPRRWFECYGTIARVGELQGDDAAEVMLSMVETALSDPAFQVEARQSPVLCIAKVPSAGSA